VQITDSPTDAYTNIARAMLACWFGAEGPLSTTHVFHAEAAPPAEGGNAEIVVHERDLEQRDRRGPRALRITLRRTGSGSDVLIAVLRARPELGQLMREDVEVWAKGASGCRVRTLFPQAREPARSAQASGARRAPGKR
jgi:hypothetical protein